MSTAVITSDVWTTRVDPAFTRRYGVEEVHSAWFLPRGWPGSGPCLNLLIPECELQCTTIGPDGRAVTYINRPPSRHEVAYWLTCACEQAAAHKACLSVSCDTREQTEEAAKAVARLLPGYERAALERMQEPVSRSKSALH
jgi:hypothetical protein